MNPQYFTFFKKASACISNEYTRWETDLEEHLDEEIDFQQISSFWKSLKITEDKEQTTITPKLKKD